MHAAPRFTGARRAGGRARPKARSARAGLSLVEVMVALTVLTISVYMLSSTVTATVAHTAGNRELALASSAAEDMLEVMRAADFREIFALYNLSPQDDPEGPGTAPGARFAVEGLTPLPEDAGLAGHVFFPAAGPILRENDVVPELGLPRDLNGDLRVDGKDHAHDYLVLPVSVRVRWLGVGGRRELRLFTMYSWTRRGL